MAGRTLRVPKTGLVPGSDSRDWRKRLDKSLPALPERTAGREKSDPQLVQACLDGDQSAWKELVNRYARLVYSIPRRYGLSTPDADDVFQNVFTIVIRRLGTVRNQERLSAWLITIAHRESLRVSKQALYVAELDESAEDGDDLPLEQVQKWERQDFLYRALERMGPPCRDLLAALFLESDSASYDRIAERLGMTVGAVGPTRARCFKKLETILKALGFDW